MPYADIKSIEAEWRARMHKALNSDGKDDYIELNEFGLGQYDEFTVMFWVKRFREDAEDNFLTNDGIGDNLFIIRLGNHTDWQVGKLHVYWGGEPSFSSSSKIYKDKWYFIAVTGNLTNNFFRIFIDGQLDSEGIYSQVNKWTATKLFIARWGGRYANILTTHVSLYNRALSDAEIKYLYHNPFDPLDEEHLVLWLNPAGIDAAAGKWWDLSGKGNHGTIYGATEVQLTLPEVEVM